MKIYGGFTDKRDMEGWIAGVLNEETNFSSVASPNQIEAMGEAKHEEAQISMRASLRALVDVWLLSGKGEGYQGDGPRDRGTSKVVPEVGLSLQEILNPWLEKHPLQLTVGHDGKLWARDFHPDFDAQDHLAYASNVAIYTFIHFLDSDTPHRLDRCANGRCGRYFTRKRSPAKQGRMRSSFCQDCSGVGSSQRTESYRERKKEERIQAAATVWRDATPHRWNDREEWIADVINKKLKLRLEEKLTSVWVVRNRSAIEEYVAKQSTETLGQNPGPSPDVPVTGPRAKKSPDNNISQHLAAKSAPTTTKKSPPKRATA